MTISKRNPPTTKVTSLPKTADKKNGAADTRKHQIISAFRSVLTSEGHGAATMRRVAKECNMKLGHLQYYYPTQSDLLDAFIDNWITVEQAGRNKMLNEEFSSLDDILKWLDGAFTHMIKNGIATIELWNIVCHNDHIRPRLSQWHQEELSYYSKMIHMALPHLSKSQSIERSVAMIAMLEGLSTKLITIKTVSSSDLAAARKTLISAVRSLLLAPPSETTDAP